MNSSHRLSFVALLAGLARESGPGFHRSAHRVVLSWILALAGLTAVPVLADGTFSAKNLIGTEKRYIFNKDGAALKVAVGKVEILYNGTVVASGAPVIDGVFVFGTLTVAGPNPGATISVTVRAWDTTTGATYAAATVRGSEVVSVGPLGGGTTPPVGMDNFTSFQLTGTTTTTPGSFSAKNVIGTDKRYILTPSGSPLPVSVGAVEVLAGGTVLASGPLVEDGIFALGTITVPGSIAGGMASVTIRAWDTSTGSTFATATTHGSETINVGPLGGDLIPPPTMSNFSSFQLTGPVGPSVGSFSAKNLIGTDKRYILDPTGKPLAIAVGAVEILVNNAVIASGGLVEDGIFAFGSVNIPGTVAGGSVSITIRAWDTTTGATYSLATVHGSETLTVGPLGGDISPPVALSNFASFQLTGPVVAHVGSFSAKNLIGTDKRYILDTSGKPLATASGAVDIVYNNAVIASGGLAEDGIFALGSVNVPGTVAGATITLTVRAWDTTTGSTYDLATVHGSETLTVGPLGGDITPPATLSNFVSFQLTGTPPVTGGTFSAKNLIGTDRRYILNEAGAALPAAVGSIDIVYQGAVIKSGVLVEDGVFALGTVTVPGTSQGNTVTVTIRAWDSSTGSSFDTAKKRGSEDVVIGPLGGDITPPVGLNNFKSFSLATGVPLAQITSEPAANIVKNQGDTVTLSVVATGSQLSYQWQKDGVNLPNSTTVSGANTATLTLSKLAPASRGRYQLLVSNPGGTTPSDFFTLGVLVPQTITINAPSTMAYGDTRSVSATSSSGLPVTLAVASGPAKLVGDQLTATGVGGVLLSTHQAGNTEFLPADANKSITVTRAIPSLTWSALPSPTYGDSPFKVTVTSSSGLPVTLSSGSANISIAGSTVTVLGAGAATITATQAVSDLFNSVTESKTFTIAKASQTITFDALAGTAWKSTPIPLVASASSKLPITFTVTGPAQVQGNTLILATTGVGEVTVTAQQPGNGNYLASSTIVRTLTVTKATPTFTWSALPNPTYGDAPFNVNVTSSSGLPVTLSSTSPTVSVVGSTVTILGAGPATLTANQTVSPIFAAATESKSLTTAKASQSITFDSLASIPWTTAPIPLVASASSKLPITFTFSGPASLQGNTVVLQTTGVGEVTVSAQQPGNANYLGSSTITRTFTVSKASQTVTFAPIPDATEGDPAIKLSATASSGQPITYSVTSGPATLSGVDQLVLGSAGTVVVLAKQAGSAIFQAGQASQTFTIKSKSTVTPTAALTFNGAVFKFTFRGEKGRTHSIESVNALNGVWKPITTVTGAGLDTDIVVPLPASSDKILFYRVRPN